MFAFCIMFALSVGWARVFISHYRPQTQSLPMSWGTLNALLHLKLFFILSLNKKTISKIFFSNDGSEFGGSIYQKVSDNLETAVNLNWAAGSNSTRFGIAAKYLLDPTASISVSRTIEENAIAILVHKTIHRKLLYPLPWEVPLLIIAWMSMSQLTFVHAWVYLCELPNSNFGMDNFS